MFEFEQKYQGKLITGIDEAGRGPLAGPVTCAAFIPNLKQIIPGVTDSKKLTAKTREKLYQQLTQNHDFAVISIGPEEIDQINILEATIKACRLAIAGLNKKIDIALIDGNMKFKEENFISIIKGDLKSYSIAAASIIAKVTRDRIMKNLASQFPQYGWQSNMGYGSAKHLAALKEYGATKYHRRSFAPVNAVIERNRQTELFSEKLKISQK